MNFTLTGMRIMCKFGAPMKWANGHLAISCQEEVFLKEVDDILFYLDSYLESELEWMDALEDLVNEVPDDVDSDVDEILRR